MKHLLSLAFLCLFFSFSYSQTNATTSDGKQVILNDDGSWDYAPEDPKEPAILSQDNCNYASNEVDEFTGDEKKVLKAEKIGHGRIKSVKLLASMVRVGDSYAVALTYRGSLGCVSRGSYAILKFSDQTTLRLENVGDTDCGDSPRFLAIIGDHLDELKSKQVEKIRLSLSKAYADLTIENPFYFASAINCVE